MADRVLVVGGAGYIGSHACKALAEAGYTPVAYDSLVYGHRWAAQWGPLEVGDIADRAHLDEVMARHRPVAAMHFAAFAYVGESVTDPAKYYANNVAGTLTLVEALRAAGVSRLVFSSTCAVYGAPSTLPILETSPLQPINPYGASKAMVERVLADYRTAYGFRSVSLRYFNAAGADPDGEIGEDHTPETHLIPLVLDAAAGLRPSITVFGDDYSTADGTCVRDYIHVSDLAEAHVLALARLATGDAQPCYNLGTGQGVSVKELIDTARVVTGREISVQMGPRRAGDPAELTADPGLAMRELGWRPKHSDLTTTISTAWAWHRAKLARDGRKLTD